MCDLCIIGCVIVHALTSIVSSLPFDGKNGTLTVSTFEYSKTWHLAVNHVCTTKSEVLDS